MLEKERSLRSTILRVTIIPTLALTLILVGLITLSAILLLNEIVHLQETVLETLAQQGDQYLAETERLMRSLAASIGGMPAEEQTDLLASFRDTYSRFAAFYLLDENGKVLVEDTDAYTMLGLDLSGEKYFRAARDSGQVYFSDPFISPTTGKVAVTVAASFYDNDQFQAMLVGELNLELLQQAIEQVNIGENSTSFITDRGGTLVAHPIPQWVQERRNFSNHTLVKESRAGSQVFKIFYDEVESGWLIGSAMPMAGGWVVVTTQPAIIAVRPLILLVIVSVIALGVSLVILTWIQSYGLSQITNPITVLALKADAISKGDYEKLPGEQMSAFKEITSLEQSFSRMTQVVQKRDRFLEQRVADRTQRLKIIASLGERLNAILNLETLLAETVNQIKDNFGYYLVSVFLLDEARENLVIQAAAGAGSTELMAEKLSIPLNSPKGLVARAVMSGKVIRADDVHHTNDWLYHPLAPETRSEIVVPIIVEEEVFGVLDVQEDRIAAFENSEVDMFRSLSSQIGVAIHNARMYSEMETLVTERTAELMQVNKALNKELGERRRAEKAAKRRAAQLTLLNDVGSRIATLVGVESVLETAASLIHKTFGYHHVGIFLLDRGKDALIMKTKTGGFTELFPPGHQLKLRQGLVGWVGYYGETLLANDVDTDPRYVNLYPGILPTRAELSVPIRVSGEVIGVLDVQSPSRNAFDGNDIMVIETVADQVAVAIDNARLYESAQKELSERQRAEGALRQERDKAQQYLDIAGVILVALNSVGEITLLNRKGHQVLGYNEGELIGKSWFEHCIPESTRVMVKAVFTQLMNGKFTSTEYFENSIQTLDGEERLIAWHNIVLTDETGAVSGTLSSGEDITERKQAEQALRENISLLQSIFRVAPVGIGLVSNRILLQVNERICEMIGYSREELVGQSARILYPSDTDFEYVGREKYEQIHQQGTGAVETRWQHKNGRILNVLLSSTPLDPNDLASGVTFTALDITERVQAEKALRTSEALYRLLAENATDMITRHDSSGTYLYASPSSYQLLGYYPDELVGMNSYDLISPEDREAVNIAQTTIIDQPVTYTVGFRMHHKAGHLVWVETTSKAVRDQNSGEIREIVTITRDITDRKRAEAERERLLIQVREQAQQVREIMNTVPEGVILLDPDGKILLANPAALRDLRALAGLQVGDTLSHLGDRPLPELLTSPPEGLWHEVKIASHIFEVVARPMTGGEYQHWVLVMRDATQEREIQQSIQQQERLAAVGQLAAGIAHDFNNILAVILLYTEIILGSPDLPVQLSGRLLTISQQAGRASDLIQQILDFSRRAVIERRPMDLLPFLKEQVKLLERTLPENIQIDLKYHSGEYMVEADPTRLQQAIMNLAVNARDAMPDGGHLYIDLSRPNREASIHCVSCGRVWDYEWLCITIGDTGCGISTDVLPHIFDPFFTTKTPGQGTGLGLAQVYGLIKQHEGHVDVETQIGEGSTFYLYLPALPQAISPPIDQASIPFLRGNGQTLLLVEDEAATRQALVDGLTLLDYNVLSATDGRAALDILVQRSEEIDLILSDVVMPKMGGIALLHSLRQQGFVTPVVLMTGHPMQEELEELQTEGLTAWLLKPPSLKQLSIIISEVLK